MHQPATNPPNLPEPRNRFPIGRGFTLPLPPPVRPLPLGFSRSWCARGSLGPSKSSAKVNTFSICPLLGAPRTNPATAPAICSFPHDLPSTGPPAGRVTVAPLQTPATNLNRFSNELLYSLDLWPNAVFNLQKPRSSLDKINKLLMV